VGIRISNRTTSKLTFICISVHRTPTEFEQNNEPLPDGPHRERGDISDKCGKPEQGGVRRPTLYLILDPDQDLSRSTEVVMLVGTKEELRRRKTGGDDVLGKGA
jgi:hypothetical protein